MTTSEEAAWKAKKQQQREAFLTRLASRPRWHGYGPKQATDPRKRRAMEETGRYLGERRDV